MYTYPYWSMIVVIWGLGWSRFLKISYMYRNNDSSKRSKTQSKIFIIMHRNSLKWIVVVFHMFRTSQRNIQSYMMTSSNGNIFCVTGPLYGEFTGHMWIPRTKPVTRSFDVFFDLRLNKRLRKQSGSWWFETTSRPLWRHCKDHLHEGQAILIQTETSMLFSYLGLISHNEMSSIYGRLWLFWCDDAMIRRHFLHYWPFMMRIHRPRAVSFDVSFVVAWTIRWANGRLSCRQYETAWP